MLNKGLCVLNLGNNYITTSGIKKLIQALKLNDSLQTLYLQQNKITNAGTQIISAHLQTKIYHKLTDLTHTDNI